jgi:hypothetical protein
MRTGSRLGEVSAIRPRQGALKSPRPEARETFLPSGVESKCQIDFRQQILIDARPQMWPDP